MSSPLQTLRTSPDSFKQDVSFFCPGLGYERLTQLTSASESRKHYTGTACTTKELDAVDKIITLPIEPAGGAQQADFFYPAVGSGIGTVEVPKDVPDGTLALSGTFNGCSLKVFDKGSRLIFMHDWNDKNYVPLLTGNATLQALMDGARCIYYCTYDDYGMKGLGSALSGPTVLFGHQLICVKNSGKWVVTNFGMLFGGGNKPAGRFSDGRIVIGEFKAG